MTLCNIWVCLSVHEHSSQILQGSCFRSCRKCMYMYVLRIILSIMWMQREADECLNYTSYLGYCVLDLFSSNVHSLYLGCVGRNFKKRSTWCSLQWPIPHMAQTDVDGHAHEVAAIRKKEEMDKGETEYHICSCCKFFYYNGWFCHLAVSAISHLRVCASAVTSILHYMSLVVWSRSI